MNWGHVVRNTAIAIGITFVRAVGVYLAIRLVVSALQGASRLTLCAIRSGGLFYWGANGRTDFSRLSECEVRTHRGPVVRAIVETHAVPSRETMRQLQKPRWPADANTFLPEPSAINDSPIGSKPAWELVAASLKATGLDEDNGRRIAPIPQAWFRQAPAPAPC